MPDTIRFHSQGATLLGRLWLPAGPGPHPAVVVTGSWLTVKEQMPAQYAPRLAEAGLAALTFDFGGFGESGGALREVESPRRKSEDMRHAVAFLRGHPAVARERIGALAVCASAGYLGDAMVGEPGLKSAVMVAPWLHDAALVRELYGGEATVQQRIEHARAAREAYARTGEVAYVPAASNSDPAAAMYWPGDALDYYLNPRRGALPQWGGRFATMAWDEWLNYDPHPSAARLQAPLCIVTSEHSATPAGARRYAAALRAPHDGQWIAGTQFDFYDNPATVEPALQIAVEHFKATL
jgi:fermentation-respiration switch protein FrsA (DUF1100 family)